MRNILKAILVISAMSAGFPAYAGGSMAPEVRVIVVNPSRTIMKLSEQRRRQKEITRARQRENAAIIRRMEQETRRYQRETERRMKELDSRRHCKRFKSC